MANKALEKRLERRPDFKDKYLDLDEVASQRKKNESEEHFKLKYIGMFWLYAQQCRPIGLEIELPFRNKKKVVDVVGLGTRKIVPDKMREEIYHEIDKVRDLVKDIEDVKYTHLEKISEENDFAYFDNPYKLMSAINNSKKEVLTRSSLYFNTTQHLFYGIEAKASKADFKNGFNTFCDYTYVIAPKGVLDKKDIPKYIGLLEVDLEEVVVAFYPVPKVIHLSVTKRATFNRDENLLTEDGHTDPDIFSNYYRGILKSISMDNWFRSLKLLTYGGLTSELNY